MITLRLVSTLKDVTGGTRKKITDMLSFIFEEVHLELLALLGFKFEGSKL